MNVKTFIIFKTRQTKAFGVDNVHLFVFKNVHIHGLFLFRLFLANRIMYPKKRQERQSLDSINF